eukprot:5017663-Prymnesium_polylepis.1
MKVTELKSELAARDKLTTGPKPWLRRRLHAAIVDCETFWGFWHFWTCAGRLSLLRLLRIRGVRSLQNVPGTVLKLLNISGVRRGRFGPRGTLWSRPSAPASATRCCAA